MPRYPDGFAAVLARPPARRRRGSRRSAAADVRPGADLPDGLLLSGAVSGKFPAQGYLPRPRRDRRAVAAVRADVEVGGADSFATSYTLRSRQLVSGAEVQATVYDNITRNLFVSPHRRRCSPACTIAGCACSPRSRSGAARAGSPPCSALSRIVVAFGGSFLPPASSAIYVPPVAPALAFVGVAGAQSARDYAAERRQRRSITRAFCAISLAGAGRAPGRRAGAAASSAASARRCRSCSATCAASPPSRRR